MNLKQAITHSAVLAAAMTSIIVASCDDNLTIPGYVEADGYVKFGVNVAESWRKGNIASSRGADEVRIEPTVENGDTLYLVTYVTSLNDSDMIPVSTGAQSRGTVIEKKAYFWKSFGVTAVVLGGDTYDDDADNVSGRRLADNVKITGSAGTDNWFVPQSLVWPATGETRFFAYAPHSGSDENKDNAIGYETVEGATGMPELTYTVSDDIKNQIDLMYCATDPLTESDKAVELNFKHALAAVTVKTNTGMLAGKLTKVTVTGIRNTGTLSIGDDKWSVDESEPVVTYSYSFKTDAPDSGLNLPSDSKDNDNFMAADDVPVLDGDLTLLMIPQELGEDAKIKFVFTDEFRGITHELTATIGGEGKSWEAGKLYNYSMSASSKIYTPIHEVEIHNYGAYNEKLTGKDVLKIGDEEIECVGMIPVSGILEDVSAQAYFETHALGDDGKVKSVNVKADWWLSYRVDGNDAVKAKFVEPQYTKDDEVVAAVGDDPMVVTRGRLQLAQQAHWLKLDGDEVGSADKPYDLSGGTESSNCYVINAPGYYKLPLVYGNALNNENINVFDKPSDLDDSGFWSQYKDHKDNPLVGPDAWIESRGGDYKPADCVLMWQDSPGLLTDVDIDGQFLTFRARPESFAQGNALVAVRDANGTVLWSWHIWATKSDYYNLDYTKDNGHKTISRVTDREYEFGRANVGYCDSHDGDSEREVTLYVNFKMPDGTIKSIPVGEQPYIQEALQESAAGDNTFYQWGRKDPMLGGVYDPSIEDVGSAINKFLNEFDIINKRYYPGAVKFERVPSRQSFAFTISHPNVFVLGTVMGDKPTDDNETRRHWRTGGKLINAWDLRMDAAAGSASKFPSSPDTPYDPAKQCKSIYDPSPRGYRIPPVNAFSRMVSAETESELTSNQSMDILGNHIEALVDKSLTVGYYVGLNDAGSDRIFFPLTGLRDMGPHGKKDGAGKEEYDGIIPAVMNYEKYNYWSFSSGSDNSFNYTWPAHRKLTFLATTSIDTSDQDLIFYLDHRDDKVHFCASSNNAYGFTVRPVKGMSVSY